MKYYSVVGYPVLHSKSPNFFNMLFQENSIDAHYTRIAAESIEDAMYLFDAIGFSGFNITTPFKYEAADFCDELNEIAKTIGAVNTITNWDTLKVGFNTDYLGVINTFKRNKINLKNKNIILLGGGNAAKAALYALGDYGASVIMVNRNTEKARKLAEKFKVKFETIQNLPLLIKDADIILSTVPNESIALRKEWFAQSKALIFDANYNKSKLAELAKDAKLKYISGLEWLMNQALPAFKNFTGISLEYNSKYLKQLLSEVLTKKENVYLIGFMGTGKSTVGKSLAEKAGKTFYDIDEMIVQSEGKNIFDIFRENGEEYFRSVESRILNEVSQKTNSVIACGGGITISEENRKILKINSLVIWLYSDVNICLNRIKSKQRPLLAFDNPYQIARKLMKERTIHYMQTSDLLINSEKNLSKIVDRIYEELKAAGYYD